MGGLCEGDVNLAGFTLSGFARLSRLSRLSGSRGSRGSRSPCSRVLVVMVSGDNLALECCAAPRRRASERAAS